MYEVDTSTPVLVTGATGYVAGWIVKRLLEAGVTVHAAVRDPQYQKYQHLDEITASAGYDQVFQGGSTGRGPMRQRWRAARSCSTASPAMIEVKDPQRGWWIRRSSARATCLPRPADAIGQAWLSPVAVLRSAGTTLTWQLQAGGVFTEDDWNTTSSLTPQPTPIPRRRPKRRGRSPTASASGSW